MASLMRWNEEDEEKEKEEEASGSVVAQINVTPARNTFFAYMEAKKFSCIQKMQIDV